MIGYIIPYALLCKSSSLNIGWMLKKLCFTIGQMAVATHAQASVYIFAGSDFPAEKRKKRMEILITKLFFILL